MSKIKTKWLAICRFRFYICKNCPMLSLCNTGHVILYYRFNSYRAIWAGGLHSKQYMIFKKNPSVLLPCNPRGTLAGFLLKNLYSLECRVVVSTAAFHTKVRGSFPGLGGLKEAKMLFPHPLLVKLSIVGSLP